MDSGGLYPVDADGTPEDDGGYKTLFIALFFAGTALNKATQKDNREHAYVIYYSEETGKYYISRMINGNHASVGIEDSSILNNSVGVIHSHTYCTMHERNILSDQDKAVADCTYSVVYLAAPNGKLVSYASKEYFGKYLDDRTCEKLGQILPVDNTIVDCSGAPSVGDWRSWNRNVVR